MKPDLGLFTYLHAAGRTQAHKWIGQHLKSVGRKETVDLALRFQGDLSKVVEDEPAVEPEEHTEQVRSRA